MHGTIKEKLYSVSNIKALGSSLNVSGFPHALVLILSHVFVGALKGSFRAKGLPTLNESPITAVLNLKEVFLTDQWLYIIS